MNKEQIEAKIESKRNMRYSTYTHNDLTGLGEIEQIYLSKVVPVGTGAVVRFRKEFIGKSVYILVPKDEPAKSGIKDLRG